ncbi:nucleoside diphosphate kinase 7-like isoform X2 [Carassius gibelio]|uniref:nucleoside diphosphate kinase 7-like isoform X2 n=1 Tax=Carassius gibelio TaxID=101364 RepID=UPI002279D17D|nr:nucleoside diphosphate kinase 7-like isoform X2 [Carassius gibelio]XP_052415130.1 nucleoside diphosphate kinase 7-like isoform X2 [Carassius gibelio]
MVMGLNSEAKERLSVNKCYHYFKIIQTWMSALPFWLSGTTQALLSCDDTSCSTTLKMAPWRWTLAMIKPDAVKKVGNIIQMIFDAILIITKTKMTKLTWKHAADFYTEHQSKSFLQELEFFFPSTSGHGPSNTAKYSDCTCCIIKPHAISEEYGG